MAPKPCLPRNRARSAAELARRSLAYAWGLTGALQRAAAELRKKFSTVWRRDAPDLARRCATPGAYGWPMAGLVDRLGHAGI